MPQSSNEIVLTADERAALEALARTGRGRADLARRARIILRLAAGASYSDLMASGESSRSIAKWKHRFLEARVPGLSGRYRKNAPTVLTPALEARILTWTRKPPANGATQWSTRTLAAALGLSSHTFVQRAWKRAGLQPHRLEGRRTVSIWRRIADASVQRRCRSALHAIHRSGLRDEGG